MGDMFLNLSYVSPKPLEVERKNSKILLVYPKNLEGFLSILDNIELSGGKIKENSDTILDEKIMKGKKKALPIVDLPVYGRAFQLSK